MSAPMSGAERRRWHITFVRLLGRDASRMSERDEDVYREMRAAGHSPEDAVAAVRARLVARHGR